MVIRTLVVLVWLTAASAQATETIQVVIETGPLASLVDPGQTFQWNRLNRVEHEGLTTPGYPVLLLLPPDTSDIVAIDVQKSQCKNAHWVATPSRQLVDLTNGTPVGAGKTPSAASAFIRHPLATEADAVMLPLVLLPLRLLPDQGAEFCSRLELSVKVQRDGRAVPEAGHTVLPRIASHVVNPEGFDLWYQRRRDETPVHDYVIVARKSFADSSINLPAFVEWKTEQGFSPHVITIEEIEAEIEGEMMVQERLRTWLQNHYQEWGIRYVLLIGSPDFDEEDGIPMKECFPTHGWVDSLDPNVPQPNVPTDMYYADLTGNWNPDGDTYPCELEDYMEIVENPEDGGARLDGVDLTPEVLVGRIPHHGKLPYFGDGVLLRTINYGKKEAAKWHNRALLASPMVTFPDGNYVDGSLVSQYLADKSFKSSGYSYDILGEWEGNLVSAVPGAGPMGMDSFVDFWNQGYGAVMWCAHGSSEGAYRDVWYVDGNADGMPQQGEVDEPAFVHISLYKVIGQKPLGGSMPPIVFHGSCLNSEPEDHGNLTHTMLRHSSIANVASTRITMGLAAGPNQWEPSPFSPGAFTMGVYFIHGVMVERRSVSDAFHLSQGALMFGIQPWTFKVRLEFNLYGDPSTVLPGCTSDEICDDGDICNGAEKCVDGKCTAGELLNCAVVEDPGPCHQATCLAGVGCTVVQRLDHAPCEGPDKCMQAMYCWGGDCIGGVLNTCPPAGVPCYESVCNPEDGVCQASVQADGSYCFINMKSGECQSGECVVKAVEQPEPDLMEPTIDVIVQMDVQHTPDSDAPQPGKGCSHGTPNNATSPLLLLLALGAAVLFRRSSSPAGS